MAFVSSEPDVDSAESVEVEEVVEIIKAEATPVLRNKDNIIAKNAKTGATKRPRTIRGFLLFLITTRFNTSSYSASCLIA